MRLPVICVVGLLWTAPLFADNWPAWRGPTGDGQCREKNLPLRWSATENVRWKTPLPDAGNSTPIVWGERIFVTQAREKGKYRGLMCLSRADGKVLWRQEIPYDDKETTHDTNPFCSASPVTDGERLIVSHGSVGMYCYDFAGKELWRKDLGKLEHVWGNASSPILYGDLAILWCGPGERQFLLAVNKNTGATVWQSDEPGGDFGRDSKNWKGSWSTPLIVRIDDHDELVLGVPEKLKGYDPRTGKELWACEGLGKLVYTSPVFGDGIFLAMGGYSGPAIAVKAGGKGDITKTHRLWRQHEAIPQRIGSAVTLGEHAYILNEPGIAQCFELATGKDLWNKQRVGSGSWGSMVLADGRLYVTNLAGDTFVLAANPKYELLAKNSIGERVLASVAPSDGDIFIRSYKHLWCIGTKK